MRREPRSGTVPGTGGGARIGANLGFIKRVGVVIQSVSSRVQSAIAPSSRHPPPLRVSRPHRGFLHTVSHTVLRTVCHTTYGTTCGITGLGRLGRGRSCLAAVQRVHAPRMSWHASRARRTAAAGWRACFHYMWLLVPWDPGYDERMDL